MIKGETLKILVTVADASAVEFRFGGTQTHTVAGTKSGSEFTASTSTLEWTSGVYAWQAWATMNDGTVSVVDAGEFDLTDPLGVGDVRTSARKMVEMIEAMMAGNASEGVRRYKINNRELERYSVAELMQLLTYWRERAAREKRGGGIGPRIAVRF